MQGQLPCCLDPFSHVSPLRDPEIFPTSRCSLVRALGMLVRHWATSYEQEQQRRAAGACESSFFFESPLRATSRCREEIQQARPQLTCANHISNTHANPFSPDKCLAAVTRAPNLQARNFVHACCSHHRSLLLPLPPTALFSPHAPCNPHRSDHRRHVQPDSDQPAAAAIRPCHAV